MSGGAVLALLGGTSSGPPGANASAYVGTTVSIGNAYVATPTTPITSYTTGMLYVAQFNATNTAAATLTISGLSPKSIFKDNAALTGGEIVAGATIALTYDGTQFQMTGDGGGGAIVTPAFVKIAQVVTSGSQSIISFPSIPTTSTDLMLVFSGRATGASSFIPVSVKVNSDSTSSNYAPTQQLFGDSTFAGAQTQTTTSDGAFIFYIAGTSGTAHPLSIATIFIPGYLSTAFEKGIGAETTFRYNSSSTAQTQKNFTQWFSTVAISQLDFSVPSGSFLDGSILTLYGLG